MMFSLLAISNQLSAIRSQQPTLKLSTLWLIADG